jgi:hypothetical protein
VTDEGPTQSDIDEFGDPNENTQDVIVEGDAVYTEPDLIFDDEEPDEGLEE